MTPNYLDIAVNIKLKGHLPKVCKDVVAWLLKSYGRKEPPLGFAESRISKRNTCIRVSRFHFQQGNIQRQEESSNITQIRAVTARNYSEGEGDA